MILNCVQPLAEREAEKQSRSSAALAATNAMFSSFDCDFMETDAVAEGSPPGMQYIEPCNPNVSERSPLRPYH
eukprot:7389027-Prymnesium_polylepis.1